MNSNRYVGPIELSFRPARAARICLAATSALATLCAIALLPNLFPSVVRAADNDAAVLDPAALVRDVRRAESWVDTVDSLRLQLEGRGTTTPREIQARRAALQKQFPDATDEQRKALEPQPESKSKQDWAFDLHRLYGRRSDGRSSVQIHFWDGTQAVQSGSSEGKQQYVFGADAYRFVGAFVPGEIPWLHDGPHGFWWDRMNKHANPDSFGRPEDFRLARREVFRGDDCYVVEDRASWHTLFVAVTDHRLCGWEQRVLRPNVTRETDRVESELAAKYGTAVHPGTEWNHWFFGLPQSKRDEVWREQNRRLWPVSMPQFTFWFSDYREAAPGCAIPWVQGIDQWGYDGEGSYVAGSQEWKVVSVALNRPLPDELFKVTLQDGDRITDWRGHDPPLIYEYKKDMTRAEWAGILADAERRKAERAAWEAAQKAGIGRPAPPFPQGHWLNSDKPLTWADLRGKVVVLDFWAEWCGPCRNDLPAAAEAHKHRATTGVAVIGVHPPGSEDKAIHKVMDEFEMRYPVFVDASPADAPGHLSRLYQAYAVTAIPDAVLVGPTGTIVAHGPLRTMLAKANELARSAGK